MTTREDPLGALEHVVLLAVLRLGPDAYGLSVRREIETAARRDLSIGAVYATLARLEGKGLLLSLEGEPTAERGGRAKRYFRVTAKGKAALRTTREMLRRMSDGLEGLEAS
jgi:DNA-binding PadR family transcriptional regulator